GATDSHRQQAEPDGGQAVSVMENPALLAKVVGKWTAILGSAGVLAIGWATGFFLLAVRFFKPQNNPLFPRLLMLSSPLKYPMMLILAYLAVRGGALMVLGFAIGVVLPLAVVTGAAVRDAWGQRCHESRK
ncbi:MAG: hypothetical protein N2554_05510, partial [Fimbriimonadales bacterium]|nr:hypothetical protein [Fimbriimonadales bacterium]